MKDIYFWCAEKIFRFQRPKIYSLPVRRPYIREEELFREVHTSTYEKPIVAVQNTSFIEKISISENALMTQLFFKIHSALNFYYNVKWVVLNLSSILVKRQYNVDLTTQFIPRELKNFDPSGDLKLNQVEKSDFRLGKRAFVIEEILKFIPYHHPLPIDFVYKVPMEKEPCLLTEFSGSEIEKFKESLAETAKTKMFNVELVSVYPNFYPGFYSVIRKDGKTKNLLCFLDSKKNKNSAGKKYYFIMGKRKDSQKTYTSLVEN